MKSELVEINGKMEDALVREVEIRNGHGAGRINVPTKLIGNKYKMYLVEVI